MSGSAGGDGASAMSVAHRPGGEVLLPVALRLEGRPCLVVGAGPVAARKASDLLSCGARVTVVAGAIGTELAELAAAHPLLTVVERPYVAGDAVGVALVVTATGVADVDAAVAADARANGILVNAADDLASSEFIFSSVHRSGPVTIAVSTSGESPALARWLRRRIAAQVGPEYAELAKVLSAARRAVHDQGGTTIGLDWDALLDGGLVDAVRRGDAAGTDALVERWLAGAR